MNRALGALLCAASLLAVPASARVVLIGVDGASWSVIDPLLASGQLPSLAAIASRGVTAEIETVEPVNSPTVWTSIATGRSPDAHGVTDFLKKSTSVQVPTIFERLAVQGKRVGTYDYLVTWPPRPLPGGFVIPGWLRRDQSVTPADAFERAGLPGYRYSLKGLASREDYVAASRQELANKAAHWNALAEAFDLDVGAVTFYSVDGLSHRFWHDSFPEQFGKDVPPPEERYADLIPATMIGIDRSIGEIAGALGPEDSLLIVSDHGFKAGDDGIRRIWSSNLAPSLARAGLIPERDGFSIVGEFAFILLRIHAGPFEARDPVLERLTRLFESARTTEGEPLYTVDVLDMVERPEGSERPLLGRLRQWAVRLIMRRFYQIRLDTNAHAYLLMQPNAEVFEAAWPDAAVEIAGATLPVSEIVSADGFSGTHDPIGILLAAGAPIQHLGERERFSVLEVAPLLAYLAGAPIPEDLEGSFLEDWIRPEYLAAHPALGVRAADLPGLPARDHPEASGDDADLIERLRSMGYID
jgi:hypothetical protein